MTHCLLALYTYSTVNKAVGKSANVMNLRWGYQPRKADGSGMLNYYGGGKPSSGSKGVFTLPLNMKNPYVKANYFLTVTWQAKLRGQSTQVDSCTTNGTFANV